MTLNIHKLLGNFCLLMAIPFLSLALPLYQIFRWAVLGCRAVENMKGKVVLITGAAFGIGEQLAYEYAIRGARLALIDVNDDRLQQVSCRAREIGSPDVICVKADVSKVEDSEHFIKRTIEHFRHTFFKEEELLHLCTYAVDHLVNNAGIHEPQSLIEDFTDLSILRKTMDVNFWGSLYSTHFAIPHLRKRKGKIIVMASSVGVLPLPKSSIYNASKASLISLYETLRVEMGRDIRITIVTPGVIDTRLTRGSYMSNLRSLRVLPLMSAEECAKQIVECGCRGDAYVRVPDWISFRLLIKAMFPEIACWLMRCLFFKKGNSKKMS